MPKFLWEYFIQRMALTLLVNHLSPPTRSLEFLLSLLLFFTKWINTCWFFSSLFLNSLQAAFYSCPKLIKFLSSSQSAVSLQWQITLCAILPSFSYTPVSGFSVCKIIYLSFLPTFLSLLFPLPLFFLCLFSWYVFHNSYIKLFLQSGHFTPHCHSCGRQISKMGLTPASLFYTPCITSGTMSMVWIVLI